MGDSPLERALNQSQDTGAMELIRKLEGIIKHERANREQFIVDAVVLRVYGTWVKWGLYGIVLGNIPWLLWVWLIRH